MRINLGIDSFSDYNLLLFICFGSPEFNINLLQIYATNKFPSFLCCITGALENICLLRDRK